MGLGIKSKGPRPRESKAKQRTYGENRISIKDSLVIHRRGRHRQLCEERDKGKGFYRVASTHTDMYA